MTMRRAAAAGFLACFLCFGLGGTSWAQDPADPVVDPLQAKASRFLESVSLGTTQTAYQELLAGSSLRTQTEAVEALIQQTDRIKERYGKYLEFEPIASHRVGRDLVLLRYLYKCENSPVVFYFTFYRPPRGDRPGENGSSWRVITVRFDTELELLALLPD